MALPEQHIAEDTMFCTVHPDREATLRCNKCDRPMCVDCAVRTPVGYRCRECVRGVQDKFYNATPADDLLVFGAAAILTGIVAAIVGAARIPLLFIIILGLPIGGAIGEAVIRVTQKRRGRNMPLLGIAGVVVGGFAGSFIRAYLVISQAASRAGAESVPLDLVFGAAVGNLSVLITIGIIAAAVYGRLKMRG